MCIRDRYSMTPISKYLTPLNSLIPLKSFSSFYKIPDTLFVSRMCVPLPYTHSLISSWPLPDNSANAHLKLFLLPQCLASVSYTHLDVYKRQFLNLCCGPMHYWVLVGEGGSREVELENLFTVP